MGTLKAQINEIAGKGVTAPQGFLAAGVEAAVKKPGKRDVAVIFSTKPAVGAAVYTLNKVQAAPIGVTKANLPHGYGPLRAAVVNSGNANACTGQQGDADARRMADLTAELLGVEKTEVAVASTGVIGVTLPLARVEAGIRQAVQELAPDGGEQVARAIMTTDTFKKELAVFIELGGRQVTIGAATKGSGMIHPNMATMLGFITTDAAITGQALHQALVEVTGKTFNMLTVDGDTSTNDMVVMIANGAANNPVIEEKGPDYDLFKSALYHICAGLTRMIAQDGEGATKLVEVRVQGAETERDARLAAKAVACSNLVKTALFGCDANWGRILAAVGYSGADFDPLTVDISIHSPAGSEQMAKNGAGIPFDEKKARQILEQKEIVITIDLHQGQGNALVWTCDFSYDYVKINADYRT
ncbi:MAG: bifunctional ornithine acetyltransferase/N-acetylglutamate synthase [Syntrophomonadaceae bacterium]|jgi:glutamate N-acetyltransferase/amino-acid N-acetyltransferase|nr:bifunctional ornithine acetyltransferase/N-acetylglutamate synthase [Syntrophomonadaceae bacterium]